MVVTENQRKRRKEVTDPTPYSGGPAMISDWANQIGNSKSSDFNPDRWIQQSKQTVVSISVSHAETVQLP